MGRAAAREHVWDVAAVAALTAIALALRLSQIHQGLFGDELFTYSWTSTSTLHTGNSDNPPLYFVLAWLGGRIGDPPSLIRLPSVLFGAAVVPVVYAVGRDTVGHAAALIGAGFMALSPFALFYGVEARPYATMVFFVALSTLALVRAVRSGSTGWWLLYAIATCAAAYTHYTTIYVLGVQALWSLWACRDRLRQPLLAGALAVLLYVPWLPHLRARQGSDVIAFLAPLHVKSTLTDLAQVVAGYPFASLGQIPSLAGGVAIGACAALGIAALFRDRYQHVGAVREPGTRLALLVALALATPLGVLVYSVIVVDIFGARQLLASLPAAALVLGAMLAALPRPLTAIAAAVIAGVLVFGTIRALEPIHRRPALNQVAHFIDARAGTEAAVVYVPVFARTGPLAHDLDIYLHRPLYIAPTQSQLAAVWRNFREVFVVGYEYRGHLIGPAPPPSQHRRVLTRAEFDGIVHEVVTVYGAA